MNAFVISMSTFNNGFLKIPVLILPFIICWLIWHKRSEKGFFWLIISMISFAIGEAACGINVWILIKLIPIFEILHGLGMMIGFCAFVLAVYFIAEEYFLEGFVYMYGLQAFDDVVPGGEYFYMVLSKNNTVVKTVSFWLSGTSTTNKIPFSKEFKSPPFDSFIFGYRVIVK